MLSIIVNLSLVGVFLLIGEYIARKAMSLAPEPRGHLQRVSRGVSLFAIVAVLQLCEALAPRVMSVGTVGLITLILEVGGICVGLGMILSGMSGWSARGRRMSPSGVRQGSPDTGSVDASDYRLAFQSIYRLQSALKSELSVKAIINRLIVLISEMTRSTEVIVERVGSAGRRDRIGGLYPEICVTPGENRGRMLIPSEWETQRFQIPGAGVDVVVGWNGGRYGEVEKKAIGAAMGIIESELHRRIASREYSEAKTLQNVLRRVSEVSVTVALSEGLAPASQVCEHLFGLVRDNLGSHLDCDVVILDWFSEENSEIRSLWQSRTAVAPTRAFLPLAHKLPLAVTREQPFNCRRQLPRFDSRPGGERLVRLGLASVATVGLFGADGGAVAQLSFGYHVTKRTTSHERELISQVAGACSGLITLAGITPDAEVQPHLNGATPAQTGNRNLASHLKHLERQTAEAFL